MTAAAEPQIIVVGAGPTGVTAAILLAQAGVRVVVLDRWHGVYPQPRAVHLDDEVHRILDSLGVGESFAAISRPALGLRLLSPDHRVHAQFDRAGGATPNGHHPANMFDQPDLESLLRRRFEELPDASLLGGAEVMSVDVDGERPRVRYRTGDREVELAADYLLGCDGARSLVRDAIGSTMEDRGFPAQRWLVVDVDANRELGHWEGVHQVCDSRRAATYMRVGARRHRWEFALREREAATDFPDLTALHPLLRPWLGDSVAGLQVIRVAEYTFRAQLADRWRSGRTFLLGDAAHLTPPFIGQGMGAGLRDAANLSWKLAAVLAGRLESGALDSYEAERRPHARAMIDLAVLVGRSMTGGGSWGNRLRRLVLPLVVRLPTVRASVMDSATPPLSGSALVRRGRRDPLAGRLCPNPVLPDGRRLDDAVGPLAMLVTRGSAAMSPMTLPEEMVEVSAELVPELQAWLGKRAAALVRPDRTVFASGEIASVLHRWPGRSLAATAHHRSVT